jgi:DNA-binding HxlR family transcriptional regulator
MSRSELAQQTCTVARTVEKFGDEWTLMILRKMFLGGRRFDDLQSQTGASPHMLSQRLKRMEAIGVIKRETYSERPPRHEYALTIKGATYGPSSCL